MAQARKLSSPDKSEREEAEKLFWTITALKFPRPVNGPLPEDWDIRGLPCALDVFPGDLFVDPNGDYPDVSDRVETVHTHVDRTERLLWLGRRFAVAGDGKYLAYRAITRQFIGATPTHETPRRR